MARWKSIMGRARSEQHMDLDRINAHVGSAINVLNRFAELKKKLTATKTQIDTIADYGEDIRRDLARELQALRQAVVEETAATVTAA
jgi:thiamine biosynthesis protein ThiC